MGQQLARFEFTRALGAAVVVMLYAFIEIVCDAHAVLIGVGDAADQVDVFHGNGWGLDE